MISRMSGAIALPRTSLANGRPLGTGSEFAAAAGGMSGGTVKQVRNVFGLSYDSASIVRFSKENVPPHQAAANIITKH